MASMNNWLGFSLSPQEIPSQTPQDNHPHSHTTTVPRLGFNSEELSGTDMTPGECFDLASDTTLPSLNLPAPFAILEAFNGTNQSHDWDVKDVNMNSSINSLVVGNSSCINVNHSQENQEPRLENFLGGRNFFSDHHQPQQNNNNKVHHQVAGDGGCNSNMYMTNNNTTIGLSMIKNWLRNNPSAENNKNENHNNNNDEVNVVVGSFLPSSSISTAQNLSLSMSTGSLSSSALPLLTASSSDIGDGAGGGGGGGGESYSTSETRQSPSSSMALDTQSGGGGAVEAVPRKSIDTFGQRTSIYRGVTRHRWTGRYEAHLWDNSCRREGQTRKGRQVYLGGYDKEEKAARAYDLAALKYWGTTTTTNLPISNYEKELEEMKDMTRQEYVASLRRKSSGFSRGASIYRGVTRHHQHGRWQARIGRVAGNKDLYLGTFSTQEEAAEAYDIAAIKFRGLSAVTNFEISRYNVKSILESNTLPIGGAAKRLKDADHHQQQQQQQQQQADEMALLEAQRASINHLNHHHENLLLGTHHLLSDGSYGGGGCSWPSLSFQQQSPLPVLPLAAVMQHHCQYPSYNQHQQQQQRLLWCKQEQEQDPPDDQVVVSHGSFQDIQTMGGSNTHNFLQPSSSATTSSSVLHNLMSLDSSSLEHSSDSNSNSLIYSINNGSGGISYGSNGGGGYHNFHLPMAAATATVIAHANTNANADHNHHQGNEDQEVKQQQMGLGGYEHLFSQSDLNNNYHHNQTRNLYYYHQHHQQQPSSSSNNNDNNNGAVKSTTTTATTTTTTTGHCGGGGGGSSMYDQGSSSSSCTNWVPTAIPTRSNIHNVASICHGAASASATAAASPFTVWNA